MRYHVDTDYLIIALGRAGKERRRLQELLRSDAEVEMSAVAWYEFMRGPRTPEQIAVARSFFAEEDGIVAFSEEAAEQAADVFRRIGSPRKRAADIAIAVTALARGATLLSRNRRDFAGIQDLALE